MRRTRTLPAKTTDANNVSITQPSPSNALAIIPPEVQLLNAIKAAHARGVDTPEIVHAIDGAVRPQPRAPRAGTRSVPDYRKLKLDDLDRVTAVLPKKPVEAGHQGRGILQAVRGRADGPRARQRPQGPARLYRVGRLPRVRLRRYRRTRTRSLNLEKRAWVLPRSSFR